jgi:hypothetical protein
MTLDAADVLVVLFLQQWIMLLFHGFVFFRLYQGSPAVVNSMRSTSVAPQRECPSDNDLLWRKQEFLSATLLIFFPFRRLPSPC